LERADITRAVGIALAIVLASKPEAKRQAEAFDLDKTQLDGKEQAYT
jgi:hypothetical protein